MTNRKLLEAAAKAAGLYSIGPWESLGIFTGLTIRPDDMPGGFRWNPLTDDGDTLRLFSLLPWMCIETSDVGVTVRARES